MAICQLTGGRVIAGDDAMSLKEHCWLQIPGAVLNNLLPGAMFLIRRVL